MVDINMLGGANSNGAVGTSNTILERMLILINEIISL